MGLDCDSNAATHSSLSDERFSILWVIVEVPRLFLAGAIDYGIPFPSERQHRILVSKPGAEFIGCSGVKVLSLYCLWAMFDLFWISIILLRLG